ncbi:MAG: hypothetical protein FWF18_06150, partial [Dehalococcoidia bacterium]|nr:hypothetical protein [Dehalococcoidia bacterium]
CLSDLPRALDEQTLSVCVALPFMQLFFNFTLKHLSVTSSQIMTSEIAFVKCAAENMDES